ncbi:UNVERIFIED_CONTAM: hypothetical protein HDU68_012630, partial [Siphonaria sp. JEL0065]
MGNGGDSEKISSFDQIDHGNHQEDHLEAVCLDSGTWPTGGGGVGSCRRDVIDSLSRVRWTAIAEIAEMELEKKDYQIEKNIKSITYLPIFDNDLGSPMENFYKTTSYGDLQIRANQTTLKVICSQFLPLVARLVDTIMTEKLENYRIPQDEQMFVAMYKADYVTPCTNIQNVMWASYLAGGKYLNDFERVSLLAKCSAVLNGMNLKKFSIKRNLARKTPTAVMLSHISPLKDVMNAIRAAYYIVHEFKIKAYHLHVYGSLEVDMAYTLTCQMAIKEFNLESNVFLKGLGNPALVLPTGWIFVNSSITEGLPLALGEAGLCGLPVVCTNVGGSLE